MHTLSKKLHSSLRAEHVIKCYNPSYEYIRIEKDVNFDNKKQVTGVGSENGGEVSQVWMGRLKESSEEGRLTRCPRITKLAFLLKSSFSRFLLGK